MIAHYLTTVLFPLADIVIDIHTGGRSVDFYPCAHMHLVEDRRQRRQMVEGTLAWNTDFAFLYADIAGTGLLPVEAERQGKIVITTEMGGGEPVSAEVHRLTQSGLRNVLVHFGVLEGQENHPRCARPAAHALGAGADRATTIALRLRPAFMRRCCRWGRKWRAASRWA